MDKYIGMLGFSITLLAIAIVINIHSIEQLEFELHAIQDVIKEMK